MTPEQRKRFTVIKNKNTEDTEQQRYHKARAASYHTNPLKEQLARFVNEEAGPRFSVKDLLNW